ncbi:PEP-utilizing enzyme [Desulforamulus ruminis]
MSHAAIAARELGIPAVWAAVMPP